MATYGVDDYGLSRYGPTAATGNYPGSQITIPEVDTAYIFPGMAATVQDYGNMLVTWGPLQPGTDATVTEFRLLSSTWGFPVDENDGTIVIDTSVSPSEGYVTPSWDPSGSYDLVFDDEFSGSSLDTSKWNPNWFGSGITGPVNTAETATYSASNATVSGGTLNLLLTDTTSDGGAHPNTGAIVTSNPHDGRPSGGFEFTYGSVEWRAYLPPNTSGTAIANWPALWQTGQSWPTDGEFDTLEGIHGVAQWGVPTKLPLDTVFGNGPGTYYGWHTFGVEWLPSGDVTFYYDGVPVSSGITAGNTAPMYLIMDNTQGSEGGTGTFPTTMQVDWVRVWQPGAASAYPYSYIDTSVSPGTVQYYGIYVKSAGTWLRGGFTAGLMPYYHGYDVKLMQDLPAFFQNQTIDTIVTDIPVPAPGIPSSGGSLTNPYSYDVDVFLSFACNVLVNSIPLGTQSFFTIPANGTVTISYSSAPEWQWVNRAEQPGNNALPQFLAVVGMGLDLVKSQYDQKFNSLNNPMTMSLGDLENLCAEIGLPYNPELPAYTTRKAALYWGRVMQERGTLEGIAEHITLLTGYQADIQTTRNFMLDDDQSEPEDPKTAPWSANMSYVAGNLATFPVAQAWSVVSSYNVGSVVQYNDLFYTCTVAGTTQVPPTTTANWSQNVNGPYLYACILANENQQPSGSASPNTYWTCVYGGSKSGAEYNVPLNISGLASNSGTWEFTNASGAAYASAIGAGFPTPQAWPESGTAPVTGPNGYGNTFRVSNNTGSTITNSLLRSVARSTAGVTASALYPDPQLVIEHGVPVPSGIQPWSATTTYDTNSIVSYNNVNFIALRQSGGATPPGQRVVLNQNYDFETGITPWQGGNATITQSGAFAYHGTHSMSLASTAANGFAFSENVPVVPGATYVATALAYAASGTPQVQLNANWNDPFGTYINGIFPSVVTLATTTWTALSTLFTVPGNAATAFLAPTSIAASTTTYWDLVELTCVATPEWAPLGADHRLPVTMSGYAISDLGFTPTTSTTVTPFAEFYDSWGNIITRVLARTSSTSGGYPANYQFDGFDTGSGYPLAGRLPAIPTAVWSVPAGSWIISSNGVAYAGTSDADAIGVVSSAAQGTSAVTISNPAQAGDDCGALFWYENTSNFWMAGLNALYYVESATTRVVAYTGTAPATGDRIYAEFNNTTGTTTIPTGTLVGPSVLVYKNTRTSANTLVVVGSGGTAAHTAMSSLTTPYLPGTSAATSNAGIASITT